MAKLTKNQKNVNKNIEEKEEGNEQDTNKVITKKSFSNNPLALKYDYIHCTGVLHSQPMALDVKIGGFTLGAYGKNMIQDTSIEFTIGKRYGLIGSNGSGKSTLLRCLAARLVPIPDHIDIYYLSEEAIPEEKTALEVVVESVKKELKRLEDEYDRIFDLEGPDSHLLLDITDRIDNLDPNTFETRASTLLYGLGFNNEMMKKYTKDMSGGWRMRVSLAQALFAKPSLLLLDEPTNHLDMEACIWLENYLSNYPRCLVTVSHSQDFLNSVCTNIMHITPTLKLKNYTGNYDMFIKTKKELEINQLKMYKKEQEDIRHIKQFIASCGTFSNLVKQAKSKQKILDKMYEKGLTEKPVAGPSYNFKFNQCDPLPPPLIAFLDVSFAYDGSLVGENVLYDHVNLGVDQDSRIAIVGPNGAGKSTLLKLMLNEIQPTKGYIKRHSHLKFGRYHQHSMDILNPEQNAINFMRSYFPNKPEDEQLWRQQIGRYGVTGRNQTCPIKELSDGIKSRIIFSIIGTENPNVLLLDEPTNHLDMECIDALALAINTFDGGLVLVSHDFRLIDQVAQELWIVEDKKVTVTRTDQHTNNIRSYKKKLLQNMNF